MQCKCKYMCEQIGHFLNLKLKDFYKCEKDYWNTIMKSIIFVYIVFKCDRFLYKLAEEQLLNKVSNELL